MYAKNIDPATFLARLRADVCGGHCPAALPASPLTKAVFILLSFKDETN
jgi:hypothetical protein